MPDTSVTTYVALGSNLGDRRANIENALRQLTQTPSIRVIKVSSLLENPAIGGPPDSPPFLNAAAEIQTTLSPRELLDSLLAIESHLGRVRREKWEPRIIDLDLLLYGNQIIDDPDLKVPHPLMHERRFVLEPLAQIAPEVPHPVLERTISQLLEDLNASSLPGSIDEVSKHAAIVVDTSAIIAVLLNEPSRSSVLHQTTDRELIAPPTLPWELGNALSAMFKRRTLTIDKAQAAIASFARIPIRLMPLSLQQVVAISANLGIYSYDACMIACAQESGVPLLTLDRGLIAAALRAGVEIVEVTI